jgi:hypothetical protein
VSSTNPSINAFVTFSPPTPSNLYATWTITNDQDVINLGTTGTYILTLTNTPSTWTFSSITFVVQTSTQWDVYPPMVGPGTLTLQGGDVTIAIAMTPNTPNNCSYTLTVTNNQGASGTIIKVGVLLTVTDGKQFFTSPDPQLVLKPTN